MLKRATSILVLLTACSSEAPPIPLRDGSPALDVSGDRTVDVIDADAPDTADVTSDAAPCLSSRTCPGQVCDTTAGRCVDCVVDPDCTGGTVCRSNRCVSPPPRCASSRECSARMQVCDTSSGFCVDCVVDVDCPSGQRCTPAHACVPSACRLGATECGTMGRLRVCRTDGTWEERACETGMACVSGACRAVMCTPGEHTCTSVSDANLCSSDGQSAAAAPCPARSHGVPNCVARRCGVVCEAGWGDCDGDTANGCETDLNATATHCGACGRACAASGCAMGRCASPTCAAGMGDCDGDTTNGCETSLTTDARNCGACGRSCMSGAGGAPTCRSGTCASACPALLGDCDGDAANGCEAMLLTDARNCGACGRACGRGQACNGAACRYEPPGPMTTARHGFGFAVGADGAVYAIGGYVARDLITPAVESYNVDTRRWTPRAPLPLARGGLAAATLRDGRVLAIGGTIGPAPTSTAAAYTPASDSWSAIASMANPRSYPAIARGIDGRVYVFGGVTNALLMRATDLGEVYDPASNSWAALRPMPRERSNATAVTASDGRIYVFGGLAAGGSIESIDVYDPTTNTWTSGPSHRFTGAYGTVRGSDGRIYQVLADLCVALSLPSTYTNIAPLHARRSEFGLVAFEDALMVFGGYGSTELATAEVYSIALNTWQPSPP